ncbi:MULTISPECIES: DUF805 domain-containing protein [Pseudomonas]|uniref:DUF805 domain-containing protein n=1 Tax=Pseudomonas quercus TaxID=2722792 RepID=A0ABX0YIL7_9PSED|nr:MULTISPECIES: DUF805 domain-containing protein [Pseudomonas]MBF7144237.1 DUF805 domain-containing protein [Pseudomonas sp. LY10J]NJP02777.1 DUF805 domain-containing protein [Pseudomonas quercus]
MNRDIPTQDIPAQVVPPTLYAPGRILAFSGRINRLRYLCWGSLTTIIMLSLYWVMLNANDSALVVFIVLVPLTLANFVFAARRAMDFGWPWWSVGAAFIPIAGIAFSLFILFRRGTEGANKYGPPPAPATKCKVLIVVASLIAAFIGGAMLPFSETFQTLVQSL